MRYLGIDYGTKKIGIAISSKEGGFAFPYKTITNDERVLDEIEKICATEGITTIILGESVNYKNEPNPVMQHIHSFKTKLEEKLSVPVILQKEILTTKEAERIQGKSDTIDASAAALILRSYLDKHNGVY